MRVTEIQTDILPKQRTDNEKSVCMQVKRKETYGSRVGREHRYERINHRKEDDKLPY